MFLWLRLCVHPVIIPNCLPPYLILFLFSLDPSREVRVAKKPDRSRFSKKNSFPFDGQKGPKTDGLVFMKLCQYFLLEVYHNKMQYSSLFSFGNHISGKILVYNLLAKRLSSNQIAGFFDYQYLWK